jgi:mono/diheme cytochrome c family protein
MKIRIAVVAFIGLAAVGAFRASLRAQQTAPAGSVWNGIYTEEQAKRGDPLYSQKCASCHGQDLTGGELAPALTGAEFASNWSGLSVGDLFERIRISMPQDNPGTLSRQQIADILAFVLSKGGFPAGTTELPREGEVLKQIRFEATKP